MAPRPSAWPTAATTGVPAGTRLTAYEGPSTITTDGTVIDGKTITGTIVVTAKDVTIRNSLIRGGVDLDGAGSSLTIYDSEIDAGSQPEVSATGLCCQDYTATRVEIRGGTRSAYCKTTCTIQDSWVHGQVHSTTQHESGIRVEQYTTLRHNLIECDAPEQLPDGGCSAGVTGYPDFAVVHHNTIDGNYLKPTTGSWCLYGGDSPGKQFSGQTHHITITNNVFEPRPGTSDCGIYGNSDSFPVRDPNSVWSNNTRSTDGAQIPPG